ncbi:TolB protein [Salinibacter ruber]|nr:TolB protein [Salinibacter ruber]
MDGGDNGDGSDGNGTTLSAPSGLSGSAGDGTVDLGWDAVSAEDLGGYNIYRSTSSISDISGKSPLNESLLSGTSYTDDGVENGTTYYYVVSAVDTSGNESDPSSEVTASPSDMTAPAAPSGFSGSAGDGTVDLGWDAAGAEDLGGYNIYRSTSSISDISGRSPLNESLLSGTSYTDDGVENGTTYYYVVSAVDTSGNESDPSSEVTASPSTSGSADDRIAFQSDRDGESDLSGDSEIYTISSEDTSDVEQVTNTTVNSADPAWSPDGNRIAFRSRRAEGEFNTEIYTIRPDGSDLRQVTDYNEADGNGGEAGPAWSPDGSRIAFSSTRDGDDEIYTIDPDGSDLRQVTNNDVSDATPAWSPDGNRIAFQRSRDGGDDFSGDYEIYTIDPDGSDLRQVTDQSASDGSPAWSPDGSRIAFSSNRDGDANSEIYTIRPDGSGLRQVTETADNGDDGIADDDITPAWSPDGNRIAFGRSRDQSSSFNIYTIGADGSDPRRITKNIETEFAPTWSPSQ